MWARQVKNAFQGFKNFNVISVASCAAAEEDTAKSNTDDVPSLLHEAEGIGVSKNPGAYEAMFSGAAGARRVLNPDVFDGCRIEYVIQQSPTLINTHCLWMGSRVIPGGGLYQGGVHLLPPEEGGVSGLTRIDHNGRLDAQLDIPVSPEFNTKLQLNMPIGTLNPFGEADPTAMMDPSQAAQMVVDMDFKGEDFSCNSKVVKANDGKPPYVTLNFFQRVTGTLCLGVEGFYHSASQRSAVGFGGKWEEDDNSVVVQLQPAGGSVTCDYMRKVSDRVNLATQLVLNYEQMEAQSAVAAEFILRTSKLTMKCDNAGKIGSLLELGIAPGAAFLLTADLDNGSGEHKVGYGLRIG